MQTAPRLLAGVLPTSATPFERTLASDVERLLDLDADEIRRLWNPQTCPLDKLPYLAWALSVDIWDPGWPESRKRAVCQSALPDHARKGTLGLIERYLGYVDATLVSAIVPPARTYATGGFQNDQSRLSWLSGLPQIRIYPFLTTRTPPKARAFYASPGRAPTSFFRTRTGPISFMQASDGDGLAGRQAFYVQDGVEVPASYEVLRDDASDSLPERVAITGTNRADFYGRAHFGRAFMRRSVAEANVVAVRLVQDAGAQRFAVSPGSTVTDAQPLRVSVTRTAPKGRGFLNTPGRQRFMLRSEAGRLVYDQISILDPASPLLDLRRKTKSFYGHARFGIAPFTAELAVAVPLKRPNWRSGRFYCGFMQKADLSPLDDALGAIGAGRALRDTVLVDTEIYRPIQLSDQPFLGSFTLGQILKVK